MAKKETKKKNKVKKNRDWNKILLITMLVLLIIGIVLIPLLVYSEIKTALPIIAFLASPVLFGIVIILLSRNCITDYKKKRERLINKVNIDS